VDVVQLSRLQFALTISFHFIFPSITIGLAGLIAVTETFRWWTKREVYDRMAVFLTKLFAITFVIGVVSGVVMEFEFGTNWAAFSGYVGDIFGAPLAAEGILAFFLESAFVGLILFGRDRISSTVRWLAGLLVAFGTVLSAFWILVANSFMQTPAGYTCYPDPACGPTTTKLVLTDFMAAVFNPSTVARMIHTVSACYVVGAFFLTGIAAWYVLRGRNLDVARLSLRLGVVAAFLFSASMFGSGDMQTREVAANQPLKFAAMEGICKTEGGVALTIVAVPPSQACPANATGIALPNGLSLMMNFDPNSQVKGLDQQPDRSLWPPVAETFLSFHMMVALGGLMLLLMTIGGFFLLRGSLEKHRWWLWAAVLAIPIPIVAVELGWMVAEVGRQPWIVYGLMMTSAGISPGVTATDVWISLGAIFVVYGLLFFLWIYSLRKEILRGPGDGPVPIGEAGEAAPGGEAASGGEAAPGGEATAAPGAPATPASSAPASAGGR
jgi:cytochrome bd ubiquinol oxidase subunit I